MILIILLPVLGVFPFLDRRSFWNGNANGYKNRNGNAERIGYRIMKDKLKGTGTDKINRTGTGTGSAKKRKFVQH